MIRTKRLLLVLAASALLSGCVQKQPLLYEWGSYEDQIYAMYSDTGKVPVEEQLLKLEADYQKARAMDKPVPPGFHAHLGYLYFQSGKTDQALQSFVTEKTLFPEATVYMNRLIARIKQ